MSMGYHRVVPPGSPLTIVEEWLVVVDCAACGVHFAIGAEFRRQRSEDHRTFYCPNGDALAFKGQSEAEKRARRAELSLKIARESEDFYRERASTERRRAAAARGQLTKLKNRIAYGVCPCCQRSFTNVRRHISSQHPDWVHENPDALDEEP